MDSKIIEIKIGYVNKKIVIETDNFWVIQSKIYELYGGLSKRKQKIYPLSKENVDVILHQLPPKKLIFDGVDVLIKYTPAFAMAAHKEIINTQYRKNRLKHLENIKIDNVHNRIRLINHKKPTPFRNQFVGLEWLNYFKAHALLWEMGTGKTRVAIEGFTLNNKKGEVEKCLVVCPLSLVNKWVEEVEKWSNYSGIALKGTKKNKLQALNDDFYDFYIMSYDSVAGLRKELHNKVNNRWMIVADESQKIKNPHAKRTKELLSLGELTEYKMILTGTPVTQHAYDLFSQFLFLNGGRSFGLNYDRFINKYFWRNGWKLFLNRGSAETISNKIYEWSTRFRKEECVDIPEKLYVNRVIDLPMSNKIKYDEMVNYCITQIENSEKVTAPIILTQLLRLSQITSGFVVDSSEKIVDFETNPKLEALRDILEESNSNGNQLVVWSRFKHDIDRIYKLANEMKISCVKLYGDTKIDERTKNIKEFQDGKARILVGTQGTGGLGVDLTAANIVVFYSNDYSLMNRLQSEDRVHRAGQTKKVTYIDIIAKETIDVGISKILKAKKNVADLITRDNLFQIVRGN